MRHGNALRERMEVTRDTEERSGHVLFFILALFNIAHGPPRSEQVKGLSRNQEGEEHPEGSLELGEG